MADSDIKAALDKALAAVENIKRLRKEDISRRANDGETLASIARRYNLSITTVGSIVRKASWMKKRAERLALAAIDSPEGES